METLIERMKRTGFNPIAVSDVKEQVVSRKTESGYTYILEIVGTATVSSLDDLAKKPATGAEIKERYPDYESIDLDNDDYIIFHSNAILYSVFKKNEKGNADILIEQAVNQEIKDLNIF